jgi:glycosyltransferase involved in cell wall biosynthesis
MTGSSHDVDATSTGKRITIITAGHVSAAPRMLKAADALSCAGHHVRLVSVNHTSSMATIDTTVIAQRRWSSSVVDYSAATAPGVRRRTGMRFKMMRTLASTVGPSRVPASVAIRAYSRVHDELVRKATAEPANLIYGGSTGALAAVAESAVRLGVPYGIDFEDLHSAEANGAGSALSNALAARVERHVISGARFVTAGSPMIAEAYDDRYGVRVIPIHNTFSIVADPRVGRRDGPLRLYWFSQTLGPQRGLEDVVRAAGEANVPVELHLRARAIPEYLESIRKLQASVASKLEIVMHDLASPDEMVALAQPYDAGLACEEPHVLNRQICLTIKIFTYLAAGIPMLLSRTPAQARLEPVLGPAAFGYDIGDVSAIACALRELSNNASVRQRSRTAARAAAHQRWHWEHPDDRGALLAAVEAAL